MSEWPIESGLSGQQGWRLDWVIVLAFRIAMDWVLGLVLTGRVGIDLKIDLEFMLMLTGCLTGRCSGCLSVKLCG